MVKKRVTFQDQQLADEQILNFDSFFKVIHIMGYVCGAVHYDDQQQQQAMSFAGAIFKRIFFWVSYAHVALVIALEFAYFVDAVQRRATLAHLMVVVTCIGFLSLTVIKLILHKFYEIELNEILVQLKDLYPGRVDSRSAAGYRRHIWFLKLFSVLYIVVLIVFIVVLYAPLVSEYIKTGHWEKILPFYLKYWFDWHQPVVFELTLLHLTWASCSAVAGVLLTDTMYCVIILLISMQFELLGKRLESSENDELELFKCIEEHLVLIRICKRFARTYAPSLLVTFLGSSAILCSSLFLTIAGETSGEKIRFSILLLVYLMNIYLLCYYGSMLMDKTSNIAKHVYQCPWYRNSQNYRKIYLMILIRGQREEKMTALKFTDVSLPCFTTILSTAFSYFTFLKVVYERY